MDTPLHDHILDRHNCGVLDGTPQALDSVGKVCQLLRTLNSSKVCRGHDDKKFQDVMDHRSKTLHSDDKACNMANMILMI